VVGLFYRWVAGAGGCAGWPPAAVRRLTRALVCLLVCLSVCLCVCSGGDVQHGWRCAPVGPRQGHTHTPTGRWTGYAQQHSRSDHSSPAIRAGAPTHPPTQTDLRRTCTHRQTDRQTDSPSWRRELRVLCMYLCLSLSVSLSLCSQCVEAGLLARRGAAVDGDACRRT
jgi:hypothetical protein